MSLQEIKETISAFERCKDLSIKLAEACTKMLSASSIRLIERTLVKKGLPTSGNLSKIQNMLVKTRKEEGTEITAELEKMNFAKGVEIDPEITPFLATIWYGDYYGDSGGPEAIKAFNEELETALTNVGSFDALIDLAIGK